MKNNWKWIVGVVIGLLILFALPFLFRMFGYTGMMGGWRHPMMGGGNFLPFGGLFAILGMLLVWAIPLGFLFLVIYGAVSLAMKQNSPVPARACPNCGKAVQADWKHCPHCGTGL